MGLPANRDLALLLHLHLLSLSEYIYINVTLQNTISLEELVCLYTIAKTDIQWYDASSLLKQIRGLIPKMMSLMYNLKGIISYAYELFSQKSKLKCFSFIIFYCIRIPSNLSIVIIDYLPWILRRVNRFQN